MGNHKGIIVVDVTKTKLAQIIVIYFMLAIHQVTRSNWTETNYTELN